MIWLDQRAEAMTTQMKWDAYYAAPGHWRLWAPQEGTSEWEEKLGPLGKKLGDMLGSKLGEHGEGTTPTPDPSSNKQINVIMLDGRYNRYIPLPR
jgi:hypothetical protein